jgi:hypothetical protein
VAGPSHLFVAYDLFGWRNLVLLCGLLTALTFALLYVLLARELRATVALGAAAIAFLFASNISWRVLTS